MAAAELRRKRYGNDRGQLGMTEVVDVVVLGDDEALPLALGERIDRAVQLEQDRPPLERELGRVRVRNVDRPRRLAGRPVPEAASVRTGRNVGNDVELLASILERALQREIVVRAHDQLVRCTSLAEEGRKLCEETVERGWLHRCLETGVQLVVERARPLHGRDVLRNAREIDRPVIRDGEGLREMGRKVAHTVEAEHRNDPAGEERAEDLRVVIHRGGRRTGSRDARLVTEDLRLEPLELRAGLDAQLLDEPSTRVLIRVESLRLPARAVEGQHELAAQGFTERVLTHERFELPATSPWRPSSRSASIRSSCATSRSSSRRRISA